MYSQNHSIILRPVPGLPRTTSLSHTVKFSGTYGSKYHFTVKEPFWNSFWIYLRILVPIHTALKDPPVDGCASTDRVCLCMYVYMCMCMFICIGMYMYMNVFVPLSKVLLSMDARLLIEFVLVHEAHKEAT